MSLIVPAIGKAKQNVLVITDLAFVLETHEHNATSSQQQCDMESACRGRGKQRKMSRRYESKDVVAAEPSAGGGGGVSLGKGAWDCDNSVAIPPEAEVSFILSLPRHNVFHFLDTDR